MGRPWAVDDLDRILQQWQHRQYRKAVLFVDNAGSDVILGGPNPQEQRPARPLASRLLVIYRVVAVLVRMLSMQLLRQPRLPCMLQHSCITLQHTLLVT